MINALMKKDLNSVFVEPELLHHALPESNVEIHTQFQWSTSLTNPWLIEYASPTIKLLSLMIVRFDRWSLDGHQASAAKHRRICTYLTRGWWSANTVSNSFFARSFDQIDFRSCSPFRITLLHIDYSVRCSPLELVYISTQRCLDRCQSGSIISLNAILNSFHSLSRQIIFFSPIISPRFLQSTKHISDSPELLSLTCIYRQIILNPKLVFRWSNTWLMLCYTKIVRRLQFQTERCVSEENLKVDPVFDH